MSEVMDTLLGMKVEIEAARRAEERIPRKGEHRLVDFLTVDDYRHAIRVVFGGDEDFEEWMVSPLLAAFVRSVEVEARIADICESFIESILPSLAMRRMLPEQPRRSTWPPLGSVERMRTLRSRLR